MLKSVALSGVVLFFMSTGLCRADVIFSENMGTPAGTTSIAANTFQNSGTLQYSGTGDVRTSLPSTGYVGASGGGNVFLTTGGTRSFTISGINTSNYVAGSFTLDFGAYKSTTASNLTELQIAFSTDGVAYTDLSFNAQPTGSGTAVWRLLSVADANLIPVSSTLGLRWTNTSTTTQFRIDDVLLQGTAVPEPSMGLLLGLIGAAFVARRNRRS